MRVIVRRAAELEAMSLQRAVSDDLCHELKEFDDALEYLVDDLAMARVASNALGGAYGEGPLSLEDEGKIKSAMLELRAKVDEARNRVGCKPYSASLYMTGVPRG